MLQFEIGAVIFLVWGQSHCNMCHFTVWMRRCNMACKLWEVLHCISGLVPWIVVRWINRDEFYQEAVNEQKGNRCQSYLLMVYDSVNTKHDEPFIICQSPESWLKLTSWGEQKCWLTLCVCSIFDSKSSTTFRGCGCLAVTGYRSQVVKVHTNGVNLDPIFQAVPEWVRVAHVLCLYLSQD